MTCRRLAALIVACCAIPAAPAHADVVLSPAAVFAVDSAPMQAAQAIARAHWGVDPCGGQVSLAWTQLAPQINATSTWTNPRSSYDDPQLNGDCHIDFNTGMDFDWQKFCTVVVHEYGHLSGHPHSPDPNDVMSAFYITPLADCVAAPNPVPAPAPAPVAAAPAASTQPAAQAPAHAARVAPKAKRHVVKHGRHHRRHRHRHTRARAGTARVHLRHAI